MRIRLDTGKSVLDLRTRGPFPAAPEPAEAPGLPEFDPVADAGRVLAVGDEGPEWADLPEAEAPEGPGLPEFGPEDEGKVLTVAKDGAGMIWDELPEAEAPAPAGFLGWPRDFFQPFGSRNIMPLGCVDTAFAARAILADRFHGLFFRLHESVTFDEIALEVTTAAGAGSLARIVIFPVVGFSGADVTFGPPVLDVNGLPIHEIGFAYAGSGAALAAGYYCAGVIPDTNCSIRTPNQTNGNQILLALPTFGSGATLHQVRATIAYSADLAAGGTFSLTGEIGPPRLLVRVTAIGGA